jgi:hypothetical protein
MCSIQNNCITFPSDPTCVVNFNRTIPVSENATIKPSNKKKSSNFNIIHGALKNSLLVFKEIIHMTMFSKKISAVSTSTFF